MLQRKEKPQRPLNEGPLMTLGRLLPVHGCVRLIVCRRALCSCSLWLAMAACVLSSSDGRLAAALWMRSGWPLMPPRGRAHAGCVRLI
eukprot:8579845-Lingulodinium_polyedra.AAC.1